jgi:hypothetical protein
LLAETVAALVRCLVLGFVYFILALAAASAVWNLVSPRSMWWKLFGSIFLRRTGSVEA